MDDKKLEDMYQATMENNQMLKSMRRSAFVGSIVKVIWWVAILIVLPYFTWLYLQPYLDTIMQQYQTLQNQSGIISTQAQDLQKTVNGFDLQKLYNQYFGSPKTP